MDASPQLSPLSQTPDWRPASPTWLSGRPASPTWPSRRLSEGWPSPPATRILPVVQIKSKFSGNLTVSVFRAHLGSAHFTWLDHPLVSLPPLPPSVLHVPPRKPTTHVGGVATRLPRPGLPCPPADVKGRPPPQAVPILPALLFILFFLIEV